MTLLPRLEATFLLPKHRISNDFREWTAAAFSLGPWLPP